MKILVVVVAIMAATSTLAQDSYTIRESQTGVNLQVTENITRSFEIQQIGSGKAFVIYKIRPIGSGWQYPVELHFGDDIIHEFYSSNLFVITIYDNTINKHVMSDARGNILKLSRLPPKLSRQ